MLVSLGTLAVLVVLYDRGVQCLGVGHVDVTVEFVVTDAETEQPIKGARIRGHIDFDRGDREESEFHLETDAGGAARLVAHGVKYTSRESGLRLSAVYTIDSVSAIVVVSAPGYATTGPIALYEEPYRRAVVRVAPRQGGLVVPIRLVKEVPGEPQP